MSAVFPRNSDRVFFGAMTGLTFAMIFVGFSRTFYLKPLFDTPALSPMFHLHGAVATLWPVLVIVQVALIRARNHRLHRAALPHPPRHHHDAIPDIDARRRLAATAFVRP